MSITNSWPMWMTFIGGIVAVCGALVSAHKQSLHDQSLNEKNKEIIELQKAAFGQITGGDSFAYAEVVLDLNMLVLVPSGEYPVYDLSVDLVDATIFKPPRSLEEALKQRDRLQVGNLYPHLTAMFPMSQGVLPAKGEYKKLNLFYIARNGYWRQTIILASIDSQVVVATQVTRGFKPEVVLYEKADEGFPPDMLRDAQWVVPEPQAVP